MRKILIITDNEPLQINGVVTTFKNIEAQAHNSGYHIVYIDPRQFPNCPALGYPEVKISWPKGIGKKIKEIQPDYIHIATEGPIGLAAKLWLDSQGWNYNTSYHTKFPDFLKSLYHIPKWLSYRYLRWFHKHSGRVLTTTDTMVQDLRNHGFQGEIVAWTRGVNREDLQPTVNFSHDPTKPKLLYVGRVSKEKSIEDLCELQDLYDVEIVGDGPQRSELEAKYSRVKFLGYKQGRDLANCYASADVFLFPSRTDTFGIVMIEAMSLGTPVAAYPVPGPIDVVEPGITGYLDWNLTKAIDMCLCYNRERVKQAAGRWTWEQCWQIFHDNLVPVKSH